MTMTNKTKTNNSRISITKRNIKFLAWNIQAPSTTEGNKFSIKEFKKVINEHDFACLQEVREDVYLPGYSAVSSLREGSRSGGVAILVKKGLSQGVEFIKNKEWPDYLTCRLKKDFFRLDKDIFLVNVYARPHNSTDQNQESTLVSGKEVIKKVEEDINDLRELGEVILCGDLNARIGNRTGMVQFDSAQYVPMPEDYTPDEVTPRFSQDTICNNHGTHFLNLVKNNQLTILNGRTLGDMTGNYTSIQKQGCSVVDYFATSQAINRDVSFMKVLDFTPYSDHKPLSMELRCKPMKLECMRPLEDQYEQAPKRFLFNEENRDAFIEALDSDASKQKLTELQDAIDRLTTTRNTDDSGISLSVNNINDKFTEHLRSIASDCFKQTKHIKTNKINKKPWFNGHTRAAKRELRQATNTVSSHPNSDFLRENFYKVKGSYKRLIDSTKNKFFGKLNEDIEGGKVLNWQAFKKIKGHKEDKIPHDSYDMDRFERFFTDLYSDKHKTLNAEKKDKLLREADTINSNTSTHSTVLNDKLTSTEISIVIKSLKVGKASSKDMMSNEIIKSLDVNHINFLTSYFNICLDLGIYPWNESIITPLHKKGIKSDPDNYRAVAVSSVLGKLFSTILLERLTKHRNDTNPDPPNQLGFTKHAQTYDHIFTMQTIASKYKKLKKRVYAVFVDFKKAFDSVCRQALFLKLAKTGITGKFYDILRNMYSNSNAYIKLSGHVSNRFRISKGTEQGHPLSPDLFKIFLSDLSGLLEIKDCPSLSGIPISHLLWADDLILLALTPEAAQKQINILEKFCNDWGIEVNQSKTKVVEFGGFSSPNTNNKFHLQGKLLEKVDSYCYLGIELHKSGELRSAQDSLKSKAMRAFFGLKRTIIRSKISYKASATLFDSLIKPITLYGAPIFTPSSAIIKTIVNHIKTNKQFNKNFLPKLSRSPSEKVHLSFLKWALGVHRKSSNVGVWGETGRYPLVYQAIRLTLNFYKRLQKLPDSSFAKAALQEQRSLKLPWLNNVERLTELDEIYHLDDVSAYRILTSKDKSNKSCDLSPHNPPLRGLCNLREDKPLPSRKFRVEEVMKNLTNKFIQSWEDGKSSSNKLSYYNSIKQKFAREPYLDCSKGFAHRYYTTQLRISAHELHIESGRYSNTARDHRSCHWCNTSMGVGIVECEKHFLFECDMYASLRDKLIRRLNSTSSNGSPSQLTINNTTLKQNLMNLLSPYTHNNIKEIDDNQFNNHHKNVLCSAPNETQKQHQSYIINCICSFICNAFKTRVKYNKSIRENKTLPSVISINL